MTYVADLAQDGSFFFQIRQGHGLPFGRYRIAIKPPRGNKPSLTYQPPKAVKATDHPNIPTRYHDTKTSGVTMDVRPDGATQFDFDMQ